MDRLTCHLTILMIMLVSACIIQYAEACTCMREHLQTKFCRADFVVRVKIQKLVKVTRTISSYMVKLVEIYKATERAKQALRQSHPKLWTPSEESRCGLLKMNPGEDWVIGGQIKAKRLYVSLCSLAIAWSTVTQIQRRGFEYLYQYGCTCQITHRTKLSEEMPDSNYHSKQCLFDMYEPSNCQEKYSTCAVQRDNSCSWTRSSHYMRCVEQARLLDG